LKTQNIVLNLARNIVKELIHFVFPAHCLHCKEIEIEARDLFCSSCKEWIQRFPLTECPPFKAVALEKEGIALSLLKEVKGPCQAEIISTMASLMAFQIIDLKWPFPDLIIPSPKDPINLLLAKELSHFFQAPTKQLLKTQNTWKKQVMCSDKNILVVELILPFTTTWGVLEEAAPKQIYEIGFCRLDAF